MVASIGKVTDPAYYTGEVAQDRHDYYAGHGEAPGRWTGTFAQTLGLEGRVHTDAFADVLGNTDPATGGKLKPRDNYKTLAYDVTFSPVKSVSVLWAVAPESVRAEILAALEGGHAVALAYLERTACVARLGRDGTDPQPGAGFAAAVFRHRFSREADPQQHFHTVIANVTQAPDGRRAALDGTLLWQHAQVADARMTAYVHAELTRRLGVGWESRRGHWEVQGVPAGLCRVMSKRRIQIEQDQAERGGEGAGDAQGAALRTRQAKQTAPDGENVHSRWTAEAAQAGYDPAWVVADAAPRTPTTVDRGGKVVDEFTGQAAVHRRRTPGAAGSADHHRDGDAGADAALIDRLLGAEGLTEQASSFGRRDVLIAIARAVPVLGPDGPSAVARMDAIADRLLADPRVIPLLQPTVTAGEVIRPRDEHGRLTHAVRTQVERRYTTADLLAAEHELLTRAEQRANAGVAIVPDALVQACFADGQPGAKLDADQAAMVRRVTGSGAGVDVVVGKAGTGKTTAVDAAYQLFTVAGVSVRGVAPSATAAHQLAKATGMHTSTLDLLLTQLDHRHTSLAPGEVVVLDEAGMCSTRNRLRLQRAVDQVGGKVIDVGDARQIPSVDVGGTFHVLGARLGAVTLSVNHRFRLPQYANAADLIWHGRHEQAVAVLEAAGAVYEHDHPEVVHRRMLTDWAALRAQGSDVRMFATTNRTVDLLNRSARARLREEGVLPRKGRRYRSADSGYELEVCVGERVRLGRNTAGVRQPDGTQIRVLNGMEGTVVAADRRGISVQLDPEHRPADAREQVFLPASYVGEYDHLDYGYARTADNAQGATIDHAVYAPSGFGSLNRGYVAMSRARWTSRIYAVTGNGWRDTLGTFAGHTPALDQTPDPAHPLVRQLLNLHPDGHAPHPHQGQVQPDGRGGALRHDTSRAPAAARLATTGRAEPAPPPDQPPPLGDEPVGQPPAMVDETLAPVTWLYPPPEPPPLDDDAAAAELPVTARRRATAAVNDRSAWHDSRNRADRRWPGQQQRAAQQRAAASERRGDTEGPAHGLAM